MDQYLTVALKAAREGGKTFRQNFGKPKHIKSKGGNPRDLVTEVDVRIEKLIRRRILQHFPTHKIIGEEGGWDKSIKDQDWFWIIDPIDGTTNFIQGLPLCCISIALWDNQGPLVGVVYNPATAVTYHAVRGRGAYKNAQKIKASSVVALEQSYGGVGWGRNTKSAATILPVFVTKMKKTRTLGSSAWETCLVADGTYDYFIQASVNIWDVGAAGLVVTEAGGKATTWDGQPFTLESKNLLASGSGLHKKLLTEVQKLDLD